MIGILCPACCYSGSGHDFLSSYIHMAGKFSIMLEHNAINLVIKSNTTRFNHPGPISRFAPELLILRKIDTKYIIDNWVGLLNHSSGRLQIT